MGFNVEGFLSSLSNSVPKSNKSQKVQGKKLEKIYLNFPGNFGRYQIFPFSGQVDQTGPVFTTLANTREIQVPQKMMGENGEEVTRNVWIKIPPKSAYVMKDQTGRMVSSLTAENEALLDQAYTVWEELYKVTDAKNNFADPTIRNFIRRKDYVLFYGYCLNQWELDGAREPKRQNFGGLFVATTKKIVSVIEEDIKEKTLTDFAGDYNWVSEIYESKPNNRTGALVFTINMVKGQPGFQISATHLYGRGSTLGTVEVPSDLISEFTSPVETFLGWQANRQDESVPVDQRRLFNTKLMQETVEYMVAVLGALGRKDVGTTLEDVINTTNQEVMSSLPKVNQGGAAVPDPMLAQEAARQNQANAETMARVVQNNTNPYQTPPAAHFDPVTSAPVQPQRQEAPFQQAQFVSGFNQNNDNGDLPF